MAQKRGGSPLGFPPFLRHPYFFLMFNCVHSPVFSGLHLLRSPISEVFPLARSQDMSCCWSAVTYEDPTPFIDEVSKSCPSLIVSPCHDQDTTDEGTPKKPHWHVVVKFARAVGSFKALAVLRPFSPANNHVEPCDPHAMVLYVTHETDAARAAGKPVYSGGVFLGDFVELRRRALSKKDKRSKVPTFEVNRDYDYLRKVVELCGSGFSTYSGILSYALNDSTLTDFSVWLFRNSYNVMQIVGAFSNAYSVQSSPNIADRLLNAVQDGRLDIE